VREKMTFSFHSLYKYKNIIYIFFKIILTFAIDVSINLKKIKYLYIFKIILTIAVVLEVNLNKK